jgi:hypothetical protein
MRTNQTPQVYINGIAYDRCESVYFYRQCADRAGHDGRHHNRRQWWTTTEGGVESGTITPYPGTRKSAESPSTTPAEVERIISGERIPYRPSERGHIDWESGEWVTDVVRDHPSQPWTAPQDECSICPPGQCPGPECPGNQAGDPPVAGKVKIWALRVPTGPVAACDDWVLGEQIARMLSATGQDDYRATVDGSPLTAEFHMGRRLPGRTE